MPIDYRPAPDDVLARLGALARAQGWGRVFAQNTRLLRLDLPAAAGEPPAPPLLIERLHGHEAINDLFHFHLDCVSPSAHLDLDALMGRAAVLRLRLPGDGGRYWHGHLMQADTLGADGGLARYRLTLAPWLAFLDLRRNTRLFQDQTVLDIITHLCRDYPMARLRIDTAVTLPPRPLTTQYRETDLAFLRRLLASEGLSFYFEHPGGTPGPGAPPGGDAAHTLVIRDSDHPHPWPTCPTPVIRYAGHTRPHPADTLQHLSERHTLTPNAVTLTVWDPRQIASVVGTDARPPPSPAIPVLEHYLGRAAPVHDTPAQAARQARLTLHALALEQHTWHGEGTLRTLGAGHTFTVTGHPTLVPGHGPSHDAGLIVLNIDHHATQPLPGSGSQGDSNASNPAGDYTHRFTAVPATTPIVPKPLPKPRVGGPDTAFVVGVAGETLTSDRDHRLKIQFPWQRGMAPHPGGLSDTGIATPGGDTLGNAPGDDRSGTWVRVAESIAGPGWGSRFLPRIGTEVFVEFIDDDPDQPLITGQFYNGEDTPPWPAPAPADSTADGPRTGAQTHMGSAALSGLHLPTLDGQDWTQWQLDDSPGQLRQRLASRHSAAHLTLGHLIHQPPLGSARGAYRGTGFELATAAWGSLRAPGGLLLSTAPAAGTDPAAPMDAPAAAAQLAAAHTLGHTLSQAATRHRAASALSPALARHRDHLTGTYPGPVNGQPALSARPGSRDLDPAAPITRFTTPLIHLDTPRSAVLASPAASAFFAGLDLNFTSQHDTHLSARHTVATVAGEGASLFTHGGGLQAIAAHGPVSLQAHTGQMDLLADDSVTVTAVNGDIEIQANQKIVLYCDGAAITLDGPNITLSGNEITVKALVHGFGGPGQGTFNVENLPDGTVRAVKGVPDNELATFLEEKTWIEFQLIDSAGQPLPFEKYALLLPDGRQTTGQLDEIGKIRIEGVQRGQCSISFPSYNLTMKV